jgi:4-hydroxybenzoate polyprenyltransferase
MTTLKILVLSSRPLSWVNTAIPFAIAYFAVSGGLDVILLVGSLFFLIPYNFLMYGINDVFDYESDLRNPRKGGIEGALLPPEMHRLTVVSSSLLPIPFLIPLVYWGSLEANGVLGLALFVVVAYSAKGLRFKEIPFLDSVSSSLHFVLPAIYGIVLAGGQFDGLLAVALSSFLLWGMASHAFGAVQDVLADRKAGVGSIATVIGARWTVRLAFVLYLAAGLLFALTPWPLPLIGLAAVGYLVAVAPWWSVSDARAESANRGWRWFLMINFATGALVVMVLLEWWKISG